MTFVEAIKTCLSKYADFNGRASRPEYWWFALFIVVAGFGISIISDMLAMLFYLGTLVPSIAAATRRLHDTNQSGWLQLVALIPVLGWIAIIFLLAQPGKEPNRFGAAPELTSDVSVG
jgi:uncharacterized membrane protein YhaH (DUF805 family)